MRARNEWITWFALMALTCFVALAWGLVQMNMPANQASPRQQHASEQHNNPASQVAARKNIKVSVYLTAQRRHIQVPLEQYVLGVVAAEMPPRFALAALEAQAIAARTYVVHKMLAAAPTAAGQSAVVQDSTADQVYWGAAKIAKKWGVSGENLHKLRTAIYNTKGVIITYKQAPIDASYFSTSNGFTENADDYWGQPLPYLQSVASPWDVQLSNRYKTRVRMSYAAAAERLGLESARAQALLRSIKVLAYTDGKRVKTVKIGERRYSGRQFRERLGLRSTHFVWQFEPHAIIFTTFGNGHGVGMSQWGAQGMALNGYDSTQIVKYYYRGVQLSSLNANAVRAR